MRISALPVSPSLRRRAFLAAEGEAAAAGWSWVEARPGWAGVLPPSLPPAMDLEAPDEAGSAGGAEAGAGVVEATTPEAGWGGARPRRRRRRHAEKMTPISFLAISFLGGAWMLGCRQSLCRLDPLIFKQVEKLGTTLEEQLRPGLLGLGLKKTVLMEAPLVTGQPGAGQGKKIGHRGVDASGETTYKKTTSTTLKGAIQLGIGYTVGNLSSKPERDVLMQDFYVVESIFFPSEGSNLTPAHHYPDFRFKTYAPVAFRYFRELFGIRPDDYLNLNQNPRTLLPKFYGLYCVQSGGKNIRVVVMNNILPRVVKMHLKYDLKGSTYKRRASKKEKEKSSPTYKDLDFMQDMPEGIMLDTDTFSAVVKTLQRDCLTSWSGSSKRGGAQSTSDEKRPVGQKALYSTAMESIQGGAARGESIDTDDTMGGIPAVNGKGERLLLHVGIIDILQSYRFIKKLEHTWKALVHDGDTVSVHRPSFYAERFFKFMTSTVFRKSSSLKSSPSKKGRSALLAVKPPGPMAAFSASQIPSEKDEAQYDLRGGPELPHSGRRCNLNFVFSAYFIVDPSGRPDLLPCTPPSFEEATTASIATTLSSTSLSVPERSPSESSEQPRSREHVQPEDDLQQITVELKPKCNIEIVVPSMSNAGSGSVAVTGEAAPLASAPVQSAAAAEVETASQASEPASQASDEDDLPVPDIYFAEEDAEEEV
ncbi:hypothetical protein lerEdw1_005691 [Lerista edwardsae]|nr:hypothetical protein lerEdw1_005691 [Lerista edwardsae]